MRAATLAALIALPLSSCWADEPPKTYTSDDVRAAFRLGVMQGVTQERSREAAAAASMAEAAKSAQNIMPLLQGSPSVPKP